jgi:5'-nucleotidase
MRILVSNDDGFLAPGLRTLVDAARGLTPDVWVVAPERKWTAASHQLSFDRVLTLTRAAEREYTCSGAPADCVIAAMTLLLAGDGRPDLVLAGLNDKINVAEDLAYSGTLAIAREATFWDVPALGVSRDGPGALAPADTDAIGKLLRVLWEGRDQWSGPGYWLSLNLPARLPAPLVQARVGRDKIGGQCETLESIAGSTSFRIVRGRPGTHTKGDERAVVAAGGIALVRHCWFASAGIPRATVQAWDRALR